MHKGNIMKFTEGGFKLWGYALAEREFGDKTFTWPQYEKIKKEKGEAEAAKALAETSAAGKVIIKDVIADAFLQNTLLIPEEYSVIATLNLNGDYISDQLAAMVGGIGIAPGANINYNSGYAIFEATHGTAPNIAGKNIVNPSSLLLSSVMMLEYMGWNEAANLITAAMEKAFSKGEATNDLARFYAGRENLLAPKNLVIVSYLYCNLVKKITRDEKKNILFTNCRMRQKMPARLITNCFRCTT